MYLFYYINILFTFYVFISELQIVRTICNFISNAFSHQERQKHHYKCILVTFIIAKPCWYRFPFPQCWSQLILCDQAQPHNYNRFPSSCVSPSVENYESPNRSPVKLRRVRPRRSKSESYFLLDLKWRFLLCKDSKQRGK